jgi:hypothetical protein
LLKPTASKFAAAEVPNSWVLEKREMNAAAKEVARAM